MRHLLRALILLGRVQSVRAMRTTVRLAIREASRRVALYALAAFAGLLAVVFLLIAIYLGLATVWPAHWAAFAVAMLLLVIAGLGVLAARPRRVERPVAPPERPGELEHRIAAAAMSAEQAARSAVRRHPIALVVGSLALGMILGLSRRGPRR